jgi:hypothetical protein
MPTCVTCGSRFGNRLIVGNKIRILSSRRRCLTCSPFGLHNTSSTNPRLAGEKVKCHQCGREYIYDRAKGHHRTECNSCAANKKRRDIKLRCVAYKGGRCERCDYCRCARALGFHHLDRTQKEFSICRNMSLSWARIKSELDKCQLLCANCHMEQEDQIDSIAA